MIALLQRVAHARVEVDGQTVGQIGPGLLVLLGVHTTDTEAEVGWLARKCAQLRIFNDEAGKMNRSVVDVAGKVLVVSQFTLYGDARKGNRPSFVQSAAPEHAERLYRMFVDQMEALLGTEVPTGVFGASMQVHLVNDGPVTLWLQREAGESST